MAMSVATARNASTKRRGVCRDFVEAQVLLVHVQGEGFGLAGDPAGDYRDGTVLAERAGGREDDAIGDAPADRGEGDPPEGLGLGGAEGPGGLVLVRADLAEHGDHLTDDERERHEDRRQHDPRRRVDDLDSVLGEPVAEPALLAVNEDERESDDDRRKRERQADQGVDKPRAVLGRPAHERERAGDSEDRVGGHRDQDGDQRQLERCDERRVGERFPHRCEPVAERVVEDHREREREQHRQVAQRDGAHRVPGSARATHRASDCAARLGRRRRARETRRRGGRRRRPRPRPGRRSRST